MVSQVQTLNCTRVAEFIWSPGFNIQAGAVILGLACCANPLLIFLTLLSWSIKSHAPLPPLRPLLLQSLLEVIVMSKKRVDTSNKRKAETLAKAIRAAPKEDGARVFITIGGAELQQRAAVMARLGVTWFDDFGNGHDISMQPYKPTGTDTYYDLAAYGVPEGSLVKFYLDVDVIEDEFNEQLFEFHSSGTDKTVWICNGTAGLVNFWLLEIVPKMMKHRHPKK